MGFANVFDYNTKSAKIGWTAPSDPILTPSKINEYIEEGFETVYNTDPVANNYFIITNVYDPYYGEIDGPCKAYAKLFRRYCQSIAFADNLGIQFNTDYLKSRGHNYYQISGIGKHQTVKIEYLDDAPRTMFHVHKNWVDAWYSSGYNTFALGPISKFRNLDIQFFRMTPTGPQVYAKATLVNMVPSDIGHIFEANYGQSGNENKYTVTYAIDRVDFIFLANDSDTLSKDQQRVFQAQNADDILWSSTTAISEENTTNFGKQRRY